MNLYEGLSVQLTQRGATVDQSYRKGYQLTVFSSCPDEMEIRVVSKGTENTYEKWPMVTLGEIRQWLKDRVAKVEEDRIQAEALKLPSREDPPATLEHRDPSVSVTSPVTPTGDIRPESATTDAMNTDR